MEKEQLVLALRTAALAVKYKDWFGFFRDPNTDPNSPDFKMGNLDISVETMLGIFRVAEFNWNGGEGKACRAFAEVATPANILRLLDMLPKPEVNPEVASEASDEATKNMDLIVTIELLPT